MSWQAINSEKSKFGRLACLRMLISLAVLSFLPLNATGESKTVLTIYSDERLLPVNELIDTTLRATLAIETRSEVTFLSEFLDFTRFSSPAYDKLASDFLRNKYAGHSPDAIVSVSPLAFQFLCRHQADLFPGVPVVLLGVSREFFQAQALPPIFVGVPVKVEPLPTIELALRLQPDAREIVIVTGTSEFDRDWEARLRRDLPQLHTSVPIRYLGGLTLDEILPELSGLPSNTIVFWASFYRDGKGTTFVPGRALRLMAAASSAPIYGSYSILVGNGIVGGYVLPVADFSRQADGLVQKILDGEKLTQAEMPPAVPSQYLVDWRQLQRWHLSESRLPPGTIVLSRELGPWQRYKQYIIAGLCLMLAEMALILALLRQRAIRRKIERNLAISNERFRLAVEASKAVGWEWDLRSGRDSWFGDLQSMFGIPSDTFVGRTEDFYRYVHPEDTHGVAKAVADARESRKPYAAEFRVIRADGTMRWVTATGQFYYGINGDAQRMLGMAMDITERRLAADRLREYENAVEGCEEMIAVVDREYRYLIANRKFLSLRNMTKEQVVGRFVPNVLNKGVFETVVKEKLDECFAGKVVRYEMKYTYPERGERDIFVSNFPIEGPSGIDRVACILQDVTERKQAEQALRQSEARERARVKELETILDAVPVPVRIAHDPACQRMTGNRAAYEQARVPAGRNFSSSAAPGERPLYRLMEDGVWVEASTLPMQQAAATGKPVYGRALTVVYEDGTERETIENAVPLLDEAGQPRGAVGTSIDLTEQKRAENALREREEQYRRVVDNLHDALMIDDAAGHVVFANNRFLQMFGINQTELHNINLEDYVAPEWRAQLRDRHDRRIRGESVPDQFEYEGIRRNGQRVWLEVNIVPICDGTGSVTHTQSVIRDITERRVAEQAQRESEDRLRLILDSTAEAIYGIDLEHRCTFCNPACLRVLGYERIDEVLGKNVHALIHHTRSDGSVFPEKECRVHRVTQTGEGVHAEDEILWRANGTSFPAEYWCYPQRRGQAVIGAVVAFIDITERKLAEVALDSLSGRLIEAQERERIRIARDLHDDIGQRLALLTNDLEQLKEDFADLPAGTRDRVGDLQKQASQMATDIQFLSHELHSSKLEYLGITTAAGSFCREFAEQQKMEIDFQSSDVPSVLPADLSLCLYRVLQEALHNSAKYSGVRKSEVRLWGTGDEVHLIVSDAGAGFDREAARESRGLGLISMEERLKLLKGTLSIKSQPKLGTMIHARVPLNWGSDSMRAAG